MSYGKIQTAGSAPIEEENERDETYQASNPQIDISRTHLNYNIICPTKSYMEIINERLSELDLKRKIRSDAILMNSFVITSDGEFFKGLTPWEVEEFFRDCARFFSDKYGIENMISAIVHMDETTPHMHLNFIPINEGRISSKSLFDRQKLAELQTQLHKSIGRKWGLQRGKEGSQAKHLSTAEFKAKKIIEGAEQRERDIDEQTEKKRAELDDLTQVVQTVEDAKNKPIPKRRKAVEAEIESLRTQNAAYKEYIAIKNRDTDSLFAELQKAERKAKANDTAFGMVADMMSAYPKEFDELLKKSREKKTLSSSFNVHSNANGKGGK